MGVLHVSVQNDVFVHFGAFLFVSVRFLLPKWPAKKCEFAQNSAKMCKKCFYAIPPLVVPPFCVSPKQMPL